MKKEFGVFSIVIGLGIALAGLFVMWGLNSISNRERLVSVRGFAEREVKADYVIWPITIKGTANTLKEINDKVMKQQRDLQSWLVSNNILKKDIQTSSPEVTDRSTQYNYKPSRDKHYVYSFVTTISTSNVDLVKNLTLRTGELLHKDIWVETESYDTPNTEYIYTKLAEIKPKMIEQATKNAREAAEQFAKDSNSKIGKIKSAQQGNFSISSRDQFTPFIKHVRVVTRVDYFIDD